MRISLFHSLFCAGGYEWKHVSSEVVELAEAVYHLDPRGIREEFWDVAMTFQLLVHERTGMDWEIALPETHMEKTMARRKVWEEIFRKNGLVFKPAYLKSGSNHAKPEKVRRALEMARENRRAASGW